MIDSLGIYRISADEYHADPCPAPSLSSSLANVMLRQSPLHARMMHPKLNPEYRPADSSRLDLGTMAHAMLLEDDGSKLVTIEADDWRTKAAKEARDAARAEGKLPILAKHAGDLGRMVHTARKFLDTSELKDVEFEAERTVLWQEQGTWCRSRIDWLSRERDIILDYKTVEDSSPDAFIRQIGRMGYDIQAAFYRQAVRTAVDCDPVFVFLAQEIEPPYACSLVALSNTYMAIAVDKVYHAIKTWAYCVKNDDWPGYSNRILYAEPPVWELARHEAELIEEHGEWRK